MQDGPATGVVRSGRLQGIATCAEYLHIVRRRAKGADRAGSALTIALVRLRGGCVSAAQWRELLIDPAGEESAVYGDYFARYERSGFGSQKDGSTGQLMRLPEAMHRRAHKQFLAARRPLHKGAIQVRRKDARHNGIHIHSAGRQLDGESPG